MSKGAGAKPAADGVSVNKTATCHMQRRKN